ncbi:hypothetical protein [Streptomyces sp. NPDC018031]|uniref:hypothetical protein n=1 Tax=Streptomyces sp. NPDC018031 TaxID=3365033 RepID=UPI0037BAA26E
MRHYITAPLLAAVCCLSLTACTGSDDGGSPPPGPRTTLRLGQGTDTAGAGGRGTVRITPDTVVYVDRTRTGTPEHGLFAVVTFKAENRAGTPVRTTADDGGFRWKAPDGHTVGAGNGEGARRIAPVGFSEGVPTVGPDTFQVDTVAFDITTAGKGGTLVYRGGDGAVFRWKLPSTSSGPVVAALESALR